MLAGYKTYLVALLMLVRAVASYLMGDDHAWGAVDWNGVLEALGLAALRAGVAKS